MSKKTTGFTWAAVILQQSDFPQLYYYSNLVYSMIS